MPPATPPLTPRTLFKRAIPGVVANLYLGLPGARVHRSHAEALAATLSWDPGRGRLLLREPHLSRKRRLNWTPPEQRPSAGMLGSWRAAAHKRTEENPRGRQGHFQASHLKENRPKRWAWDPAL